MSALTRILRWVGGLVLMGAVVAASHISWTPDRSSSASLRLSWRFVTPTIQACRPPTEEELAGLPQHMRPQEICGGGAVPYFLRVRIDGEVLRDGTIEAHGERALTVYDEFPLPAGSHDVEIVFAPDSLAAGLDWPVSPRLDSGVQTFHDVVVIDEGRAVLVTLDPHGFRILR